MNPVPALPGQPRARLFLAVLAWLSLFLVAHNYVLNLLPYVERQIAPSQVRPDSTQFPSTFSFPFDASVSDGPHASRTRVRVSIGNLPTPEAAMPLDVVRTSPPSLWAHVAGRIVFSVPPGTDMNRLGENISVTYPVLYRQSIGWIAVIVFALSVIGLWRTHPAPSVPTAESATPGPGRYRLQIAGATLLFATGLYCNTGTLTPYALTTIPHVSASGYLYNPDHAHFQALFNFVDHRDPKTWESLLVRRILYNVLAYPFMKAAGWEWGGTIASICFNVAAFFLFVRGVRQRIGERGAVFAAWLLAVYPGAAYWAGLPYLYALIVPGSLLLMLALVAMAEDPGWRPVIAGSLLMGLANLGYEFFAFFAPATLLLLLWRRRWLAAGVSLVLQLAPLFLWILALKHVFKFDLANSNSSAFGAVLGAYLHPPDFERWRATLATVPDVGLDVFFGANFLFLPLLFLVVLALNAVTSRIRLHPAELLLLLTSAALFLFNNLAPEYVNTWQLRGTWIARIYQPMFPVFLWFGARWYQRLPSLRRGARAGVLAALGGCFVGNLLVVFGPILGNPAAISETAFYRFYDHAEHAHYERNLEGHERRLLARPGQK
jgi:hypothetical protein